MLRRLFIVASALSLLVALAAAVLWVRSYWKADDCVFRRTLFDGQFTHKTLLGARSEFGGIQLLIYRASVARPTRLGTAAKTTSFEHTSRASFEYPRPEEPTARTRLGSEFQWLHRDFGADGDLSYLEVTLPWPVFFSLCLLTIFLLCAPALRIRGRKRMGHCLNCGYDLRASAERCPECATPIPAKQESAPLSN